MICRRYFVSGRVQGVFYRSSAQRQAVKLGLRGWARNLADGRVEVMVYNPAGVDDDIVMEFEKWLEIGPEYAKVTNIEGISENIDDVVGDLADVFEVRATTG